MNTARRFVRFNMVGALGIGVQVATIWALTELAGAPYLPSTIAGVSAALAHNFCWHLSWTWGDRRISGRLALQAFLSFLAANGAVSFVGNVAIMIALVGGAGIPVLIANLVAIAACGLINFWLGDRLVFRPSAARTSIPTTSG